MRTDSVWRKGTAGLDATQVQDQAEGVGDLMKAAAGQRVRFSESEKKRLLDAILLALPR